MEEKQRKERLYPNLIQGMIEALQLSFSGRNHAAQVLATTLKKNKKWGARDRAFIAENFYRIVRWYRLFYEVLGHQPQSNQDWWHLFGISKILDDVVLPPWTEFEGLEATVIQQKAIELQQNRAIRHAIPDWIDAIGQEQLGGEWDDYLTALNKTADVIIRANTLKTTAKKLQNVLAKDGITTQLLGEDALLVVKRKNLQSNQWFKKGWFEIQDLSSQQIAKQLDVQPGMTVIDACAGAGGKSLHIAALMKNKGRIIAMDINARKLQELQKRAKRNGITIIETVRITKDMDFSPFAEMADRLLLDVPCSGLGVLRRKPDTKWKLLPEQLSAINNIQQNILANYTSMLQPDGKLAYATCSILPSENENRIEAFLGDKGGEYEMKWQERIKPQQGYDGFFMAVLEKV